MDPADGTTLQDAWLREVQRRHMERALRGAPERRGGSSMRPRGNGPQQWRTFERSVRRPTQQRFADFGPYMRGAAEASRSGVPEAVMEDLRGYFELLDSSGAPSRSGLPSAPGGLTDAEFARLPTKRAGTLGLSECAICLRSPAADELLKQMPGCAHAFHARCLRRWLNKSRACPLCRQTVPKTHHRQNRSATQPPQQQQQPPPPPLPASRTPETAPEPSVAASGAPRPATSEAGAGAGDRGRRSTGRQARPGQATSMARGRGAAGVARAATPAAGGASRIRVLGRTADGGVILRHYATPPPGVRRPPRVPADAELLVVRYPSGVARVWRAPNS